MTEEDDLDKKWEIVEMDNLGEFVTVDETPRTVARRFARAHPHAVLVGSACLFGALEVAEWSGVLLALPDLSLSRLAAFAGVPFLCYAVLCACWSRNQSLVFLAALGANAAAVLPGYASLTLLDVVNTTRRADGVGIQVSVVLVVVMEVGQVICMSLREDAQSWVSGRISLEILGSVRQFVVSVVDLARSLVMLLAWMWIASQLHSLLRQAHILGPLTKRETWIHEPVLVIALHLIGILARNARSCVIRAVLGEKHAVRKLQECLQKGLVLLQKDSRLVLRCFAVATASIPPAGAVVHFPWLRLLSSLAYSQLF